jgi:hypothetical protein
MNRKDIHNYELGKASGIRHRALGIVQVIKIMRQMKAIEENGLRAWVLGP